MSYKIVATESFIRDSKHLSKKYASFKKDLAHLEEVLETNPTSGMSLGNNCFKIRLAITSKGKGKSGGGRVITCVKIIKETVFLLSVYDKSEQEDLSDKELNVLVSQIPD